MGATGPRRVRGVGAPLVLCAALVAGCSGDDDAAAASDPAPSASSSGTESGESPGLPSATTSPAGEAVRLRDLSIQVPRGWAVDERSEMGSVIFDDNQPESGLIYVDDETALPNEDFEDVARLGLEAAGATGHEPRRVGNRMVGGREGYVLVGSTAAYEKFYEWGTRTDANWVRVQFEWVIEPRNADQVIDAVLAGIEFE